MTPDEEAVRDEFVARIKAFGGRDVYCAAFGVDRRNFDRYMKGRIPTISVLFTHLRNLGVSSPEFFRAAHDRLKTP